MHSKSFTLTAAYCKFLALDLPHTLQQLRAREAIHKGNQPTLWPTARAQQLGGV
jgi:hypothetical protein